MRRQPSRTCTPTTPSRRGIRSGDRVRVFNDRGSLFARADVNGAVRPGVVRVPSTSDGTSCHRGNGHQFPDISAPDRHGRRTDLLFLPGGSGKVRRLRSILAACAASQRRVAAARRRSSSRRRMSRSRCSGLDVVHAADPKTAMQLVRGFHGVEQNAWRWTMGTLRLLFRSLSGAAEQRSNPRPEVFAPRRGRFRS